MKKELEQQQGIEGGITNFSRAKKYLSNPEASVSLSSFWNEKFAHKNSRILCLLCARVVKCQSFRMIPHMPLRDGTKHYELRWGRLRSEISSLDHLSAESWRRFPRPRAPGAMIPRSISRDEIPLDVAIWQRWCCVCESGIFGFWLSKVVLTFENAWSNERRYPLSCNFLLDISGLLWLSL